MAYQINVLPSDRQFQAEDSETILATVLRQDAGLPHDCKNGACDSCKGHARGDSVAQGNHLPNMLTAQETTKGCVLFHCITPAADVTVEVCEAYGADGIPIKKIPYHVASLEEAAPSVTIIKLQLLATERMQLLTRQYAELLLRDGKRRNYLVANPLHDDGLIELCIRHVPGGVFTDYVLGTKEGVLTMKERDIPRSEGPLDSLFLRGESDKLIILLAPGTGFASTKAIIKHTQFINSTRPMTLYQGGRRPQDLYMHVKAEEWTRTLPNFTYVPTVSNALPGDAWAGRTGFVHQAMMADHLDLSGHEVYACGAPVAIGSACTGSVAQCGMHPDVFFTDSFTSEADLHPAN